VPFGSEKSAAIGNLADAHGLTHPVTSYASSSSDLSDKLHLGWRTMILHHDVGFVLSVFNT
jgi:hypothetical protein